MCGFAYGPVRDVSFQMALPSGLEAEVPLWGKLRLIAHKAPKSQLTSAID